jgi:hypothetical protein
MERRRNHAGGPSQPRRSDKSRGEGTQGFWTDSTFRPYSDVDPKRTLNALSSPAEDWDFDQSRTFDEP